ncbi:MAG: methyltransferase [Desulfobacteraceae bacterium]|nr:methyltransferase [Desulfobacteraceae bacterium]
MEQTWHPGTLLRLSGSYWQAFALHAGVKLRIFSILASGAMTARTVAGRAEADEAATARLLDALSAMALLSKKQDRYELSDAARRYLVEGADEFIGYMILHHHYLAPSWTRLDEAVKLGKAVRRRASHGDDQEREAFLMGMFNQAMQQATAIADHIDLRRQHKLIDLGGGPGTYAIHFCQKNPRLEAVVFDLPTTQPVAEKTIARFGLSQRIQFSAGDYLSDELPGQYDTAWLSHILHAQGPGECRNIIAKVVKVLSPGAKIFIHEFILTDTKDGPLYPTLFSLNMLLGTGEGRSYSQMELVEILKSAGVTQIERTAYKGPTESGIIGGVIKK